MPPKAQQQVQPFRILMVLDQPFPQDIRVLNEALSLLGAGMQVTLLSIGPDDRPTEDSYRGITILRFKVPGKLRNWMRGMAGSVPLLTVFLAWLLPRVHRRHPFDCLHMHDLYLVGGGLAGAKRLKLPLVADLHENWVRTLSDYAWSTRYPAKLFINIACWKKLQRRWLLAADRVIAVADEGRRYLTEAGIPGSKITLVPNTINTQDFDRYPLFGDVLAEVRSPFSLVYTGTIELNRGLNTLIRAMVLVRNVAPARLFIVGKGRIRPDLEALAHSLGLRNHIIFAGWRPQEYMKSYIVGCDVCMLPRQKTAQTDAAIPHKLFHYMYLQRPVVATDCIPLQRIINDAQCGIICRSGDPKSMSEAILTLYHDPDLRRRMGIAGHQAIQQRYSWDHTAQGLVRLYQELQSAA